MFMRAKVGRGIVAACLVLLGGSVRAAEPVNPDLIPEARAVFNYLESIYGKKTLSGVSGMKNAASILEASGKEPAVLAVDLCGWSNPTWGEAYCKNVQKSVDEARAWWEKGGIVSMQFHWKNPMKPDGNAWVKPPKGTGPFHVANAVKPGTEEHKAVMRDLEKHADYLRQLLDARVPVLWRPFHEIDGGWFWWTDGETPENTAALWRLMFDYFVKERKLNHLIWVYSAGVAAAGAGKDVTRVDLRKRFYPGDAYVDISGIDIYPGSYHGWGDYREDSYAKAFEIMTETTPNKMLALTESAGIPDPDLMMSRGPRWLYCLPWFGAGEKHPADWIKKTYRHEFVITLDELPDLKTAAREKAK